PLRLEVGPRDAASESVVLVRRDTRQKEPVGLGALGERVAGLLDELQGAMFERALSFQQENTFEASGVEEMNEILERGRGFILAGWCGSAECEATVKDRTKATIRVIPFEDKGRAPCLVCGTGEGQRVLFARAY
ncbi:MAG: proline--tRNA ligase, partial [Chloroflexota bacterium]|nr:proline--tRNA ligase [Chloroflexota bacterium]